MIRKIDFNKEQAELIRKCLKIDPYKELTEDEELLIVDGISDFLCQNGFDINYEPTKDGLICESILDKLAE